MVSEESRTVYLGELLQERGSLENEIQRLSVKLDSLRRKKDDFDRDSSQFWEEVQKNEGLIDNAFYRLKKVNLRIEKVENGSFDWTCSKCGEEFTEEELSQSLIRELCVKCQKEVNANSKR